MSFASFDLRPELLRAIADLGFTEPTPIQRAALPPGLAGRDVLACAMTGSGKTAAFVLPILQRLAGKPRGTTRALVLAPTRELAAQIVEHFSELAKHTPYKAAAIYGGVGMEPQERALRAGVDVVVACPGRLLDHMQNAWARMPGLEVLVLDEVDRMLDMGFLPDIRRVLRQIPKVQQTLLFSATLPPAIRGLANELLNNPAAIDVERVALPATGVRQAVFQVREDLKPALLHALLQSQKVTSAIVFTRTKHRTNRLAELLAERGINCVRLHGNRSQAQRTDALSGFRNGRFQVLVATDVAARGIDVEDLSHVINFDVPMVPEDYIHRVGRTARAGATGEAYTFVSPGEQNDLRAIERAVGKAIPRQTLSGFDYAAPPQPPLEIPIGQRIAEIRARKADERARARAKAERKATAQAPGSRTPAPAHSAGPSRHGGTTHVPAALRHGGGGHAPAAARNPAGVTPRPDGARPGSTAAPQPSRQRLNPPARRRRF